MSKIHQWDRQTALAFQITRSSSSELTFTCQQTDYFRGRLSAQFLHHAFLGIVQGRQILGIVVQVKEGFQPVVGSSRCTDVQPFRLRLHRHSVISRDRNGVGRRASNSRASLSFLMCPSPSGEITSNLRSFLEELD
jgi:hypothetical protein